MQGKKNRRMTSPKSTLAAVAAFVLYVSPIGCGGSFGNKHCFCFVFGICLSLLEEVELFAVSHLLIKVGFDEMAGVQIFLLLFCLLFFFLFVDENFMDLCNFPYVLRAMPVFGVLSCQLRMWCLS